MSHLYVVPTPIGNKNDITLRALELLKTVDNIICEDTRSTKKLLELYNISIEGKRFHSFFEPKEEEKLPEIITTLLRNEVSILVSDAGTPLLSDPGYILIENIRKNFADKITVEVLPGASAITTALVTSGLPTGRFTFLGFAPQKIGKQKKFFESLIEANKILKNTYALFESPHRIIDTIEVMNTVLGENVEVALCRELTKKFESVSYGRLGDIKDKIDKGEIRIQGEFVIVFKL